MRVDYFVAFKRERDADWSADYFFKRDLYSDATLDESLDTGIIVDVPAELRDIPPFSLCRVIMQNADTQQALGQAEYYLTADAEAEAVTLFGVENSIGNLQGQLYRQKINLIELTKLLERVPCDSLSFTHRMRESYFAYAKFAGYTATAWKVDLGSHVESDEPLSYYRYHADTLSDYFVTPANNDNFSPLFIPAYAMIADVILPEFYLTVRNPNNELVLNNERIRGYSGTQNYNNSSDYNNDFCKPAYVYGTGSKVTFNTNVEGVYKFSYLYRCTDSFYDYFLRIECEIELRKAGQTPKSTPSITDVLERIVNVGQTRPIYKEATFKLHQDVYTNFSNTPSPEFFIPRMTMFEAFLEVGKKIHAIPRLTEDRNPSSATYEKPCVITYDLLGRDEKYTIPSGAVIIGHKNRQAADDFCGAIDNYVENHINTVDPNAGTITEPFEGGYKTLVCESGSAITNETAVFEASKPIYRVVKFEMAFTQGSQGTVIGDLTKYLYEKAEYDGLFVGSNATYPNSVSYALVWTQGDRYIRGFNTSSASILNILQNFEEPAIQKIVNHHGGTFGTNNYGDLAFRLTYIPMDAIRLRQYKPYATHPHGNVLYNQQNANTVEGSYYGESLKGKIARMGNKVDVYTIRYSSPLDLPKIGQILVDENGDTKGYIYKVTKRTGRDFTVADVYITPDFNRLSEYFALQSNFRLFEVSERQSIDRAINISRIIRVYKDGGEEPTEPRMLHGRYSNGLADGFRRFMGTFIAGTTGWENSDHVDTSVNNKRANIAVVRLLDHDFGQVGDYCFALPVNSTACGNSLSFSFGFADSYSAGTRSASAGYDSNASTNYQWKQRKNSPYGGVYGDFYAMEFAIGKTLSRVVDATVEDYAPTYAHQTQKGGFDDSLPTIEREWFVGSMKNSYISTNSILLLDSGQNIYDDTAIRIVDKNSSEHISVVVQFHGQAVSKDIVFGSAMWNNNLLIRDEPVKDDNGDIRVPHVYGLKSGFLNSLRNQIEISDTSKYVDLGEIQDVVIYQYHADIPTMRLSYDYDFVAWCIADSVNGDVYIGLNEEVTRGNFTSTISFYFDTEA